MDDQQKETINQMARPRHYLHWAVFILVVGAVSGFVLYQINRPDSLEVDLNITEASATTAIRLSPTSATVALNQTFTVDINLDSGGENVDGVDIFYLRFNPAVLQVVDAETSVTGVQIASASLLPLTSSNSVNNTTGQIQFSQTTAGGSTYTGSGRLATITFRAAAGGSSNITFDFAAGSTIDTNVSSAGADKLSIVANSTVVVDVTAPTVNVTAPVSAATVSGTVPVTATASDNTSLMGVQFKIDGTNVGSEDTTSPYSFDWNSTTVANGNHTISATARDAAGLTATSAVTVNVQNATPKTTTINITMEGKASRVATGKVSVLTAAKAMLQEPTFTTNTLGQANLSISVIPQQVYLKVAVPGYLTRLMGPYDYNLLPTSVTFPVLLAGDLNSDNIINSIDFSYLNSKWFGNDALADINTDGIVNSVDFSWLNKNWFVSGQI